MATGAPAGENIQINITENGTTTLATAGKYCKTNVDVNVNVPQKATQFTNLYDVANVVLKTVSGCSSGTTSFTTDNYVNYVKIPFHHVAGEEIAIRARGISIPVRDRNSFTAFDSDGTTVVTWGQLTTNINISYDEYGDQVMTFKATSSINTRDWEWIHLNFQYTGINGGAATAYEGPIITINEPIGNGGYAE